MKLRGLVDGVRPFFRCVFLHVTGCVAALDSIYATIHAHFLSSRPPPRGDTNAMKASMVDVETER